MQSSSAKYSQEAATDLAQFFANALAKEFVDFAPETVFSARPALHFNLFSAEPSPPFALLDILHELRLLIPSLGMCFAPPKPQRATVIDRSRSRMYHHQDSDFWCG